MEKHIPSNEVHDAKKQQTFGHTQRNTEYLKNSNSV